MAYFVFPAASVATAQPASRTQPLKNQTHAAYVYCFLILYVRLTKRLVLGKIAQVLYFLKYF